MQLTIPSKCQKAWYCSDSQNLLLDVGDQEGGDIEWARPPVPLLPDGISLRWEKIPRETRNVNQESTKGNLRGISLCRLVCSFADPSKGLRYVLAVSLTPLFHPLLKLLESAGSLTEQQDHQKIKVFFCRPASPRWPCHPNSSHPALQFIPFLGCGKECRNPWTVCDPAALRPR